MFSISWLRYFIVLNELKVWISIVIHVRFPVESNTGQELSGENANTRITPSKIANSIKFLRKYRPAKFLNFANINLRGPVWLIKNFNQNGSRITRTAFMNFKCRMYMLICEFKVGRFNKLYAEFINLGNQPTAFQIEKMLIRVFSICCYLTCKLDTYTTCVCF